MTNLETTQKINANKIFTCTRREFTPDFKAMVVKEYEALEKNQLNQQELQALRAENKALKTLLKVYMK